MLFDLQPKQSSWQGINVVQTVFKNIALINKENKKWNITRYKTIYYNYVHLWSIVPFVIGIWPKSEIYDDTYDIYDDQKMFLKRA